MSDPSLLVVDQLCLEFEDQLRSGKDPQIENFLNRVDDATVDQLLYELIVLEADFRDVTPSHEELTTRFPSHEETIGRALQRQTPAEHKPYHSGDCIGRFKVSELVSAGNFGWVYRAWDNELNREVALKIPQFRNLADEDVSKTFQQEANAIARLEHENLVRIHDIFRDKDGWPVLVLEYLHGTVLSAKKVDDVDQVVGWLTQVCRGLDYAHQRGIVHRDVKPDNIHIDENGKAVLVDFGLSIHYPSQLQERASAGTLKYMSPEQLRQESHWVDGRSDIWSLGVILYEMGCGQLPFQGETPELIADAILKQPVRPPRQLNPSLSQRYEEICLRCLQKSPSDRFSTAADLADCLGSLSDESKDKYRTAGIAALALVALTLLGGVSYWSMRPTTDILRTPTNQIVAEVETCENEKGLVVSFGFEDGVPPDWTSDAKLNTLDDYSAATVDTAPSEGKLRKDYETNFALRVYDRNIGADGPALNLLPYIAPNCMYWMHARATAATGVDLPIAFQIDYIRLPSAPNCGIPDTLISGTAPQSGWRTFSGGFRTLDQVPHRLTVRSEETSSFLVDDVKLIKLEEIVDSNKIGNGSFATDAIGGWRCDRLGAVSFKIELEKDNAKENRFLAIRDRRGEDIGVAHDIRPPFASSYHSLKARIKTFADHETEFELQYKRVYNGSWEPRYASKYVDVPAGEWVDTEYFFYIEPGERDQLQHIEIGIFAQGSRDYAIDDISVEALTPVVLDAPPSNTLQLKDDF